MPAPARTGAVLTAGMVLALVPVGPALASCAQRPSTALGEHPDVVVGTAVEQRGPHALLAVEEVWAGADRPPRLWVRTRDGSSTDVALIAGRRYAVGVHGEGPRTNTCLVVADADAEALRDLRPDAVRPPAAGADPGDEPRDLVPGAAAGLVLGGGVVLGGGGGSWAARWLRRPAASPAARPRTRGPAPG